MKVKPQRAANTLCKSCKCCNAEEVLILRGFLFCRSYLHKVKTSQSPYDA